MEGDELMEFPVAGPSHAKDKRTVLSAWAASGRVELLNNCVSDCVVVNFFSW
jgi:hypothetical protein